MGTPLSGNAVFPDSVHFVYLYWSGRLLDMFSETGKLIWIMWSTALLVMHSYSIYVSVYILLRLWKFTEHHSGFPEISYVGKCVFQVRFPHQCLTGIIRVPGYASLS